MNDRTPEQQAELDAAYEAGFKAYNPDGWPAHKANRDMVRKLYPGPWPTEQNASASERMARDLLAMQMPPVYLHQRGDALLKNAPGEIVPCWLRCNHLPRRNDKSPICSVCAANRSRGSSWRLLLRMLRGGW